MKRFLFCSILFAALTLHGCGPSRPTDPNEVALELLKVSGQEAQMSAMLDTMTSQMPVQTANAFKGLINADELTKRVAPVYVKNFTVDEMSSMIDFYNSEVGKKLKSKGPTLVKEGGDIGQQYITEKMAAIQQVR